MESDKSLKDVNFGFSGIFITVRRSTLLSARISWALAFAFALAKRNFERQRTRTKIPIFIVISVNFFANKRAEEKGEERDV
jgi:hypothetical protein